MHYPGTDPTQLTDNEWAELIEGWRFVKKLEREQFENSLRKALIEMLTALFKK